MGEVFYFYFFLDDSPSTSTYFGCLLLFYTAGVFRLGTDPDTDCTGRRLGTVPGEVDRSTMEV